MNETEFANDLCFSGQVVTFHPMEYDGYFGGALTIKGASKRKNALYSKECQLGFLVPTPIWQNLISKGYEIGSSIEVAGHFETWSKQSVNEITGKFHEKIKTVHIVDQVISA